MICASYTGKMMYEIIFRHETVFRLSTCLRLDTAESSPTHPLLQRVCDCIHPILRTDRSFSVRHQFHFKISAKNTGPICLLETEGTKKGIFTQGSRPGRTLGKSAVGFSQVWILFRQFKQGKTVVSWYAQRCGTRHRAPNIWSLTT
jgi:hypothetical protein